MNILKHAIILLNLKHNVRLLAGLLLAGIGFQTCVMAQVPPRTGFVNVNITDNNSGHVVVTATITSYYVNAYTYIECKLTNGLLRFTDLPTMIPSGSPPAYDWSNTNWYPYFRGLYNVELVEYDSMGIANVMTQHLVSTSRALSGTLESYKYQGLNYNPTGFWYNIFTNELTVATPGPLEYAGIAATTMYAVPLTLQIANQIPTNIDQSELEAIRNDISPFMSTAYNIRFTTRLHERPLCVIGDFVKYYRWTPDDTNNLSGSGMAEADVTCGSPWFSVGDRRLTNHVGVIYEFSTNTALLGQMRGLIMSTVAHYVDVTPVMPGSALSTATNRVGLCVTGPVGNTNGFNGFIPDSLLASWGVTNVTDTNSVANQLRFYINGEQSPWSLLIRSTGSTNIIHDQNYDWDGDGTYDAGYRFLSGHLVTADQQPPTLSYKTATVLTGMVYEIGHVAPSAVVTYVTNALAADFDGDAKADPATYSEVTGSWRVRLSSANYALVNLAYFGGYGYQALAADFDGDAKSDPAIYCASNATWVIKLSSAAYAEITLSNFFGGPGYAAMAGDFDGDGLADPTVYKAVGGTWMFKLSSAGYNITVTKYDFLGWTDYVAVVADFDGDSIADIAVTGHTWVFNWCALMSSSEYNVPVWVPSFIGRSGFYEAVAADFDGDGLADPAVFQTSGEWKLRLSGSSYTTVTLTDFLSGPP